MASWLFGIFKTIRGMLAAVAVLHAAESARLRANI